MSGSGYLYFKSRIGIVTVQSRYFQVTQKKKIININLFSLEHIFNLRYHLWAETPMAQSPQLIIKLHIIMKFYITSSANISFQSVNFFRETKKKLFKFGHFWHGENALSSRDRYVQIASGCFPQAVLMSSLCLFQYYIITLNEKIEQLQKEFIEQKEFYMGLNLANR